MDRATHEIFHLILHRRSVFCDVAPSFVVLMKSPCQLLQYSRGPNEFTSSIFSTELNSLSFPSRRSAAANHAIRFALPTQAPQRTSVPVAVRPRCSLLLLFRLALEFRLCLRSRLHRRLLLLAAIIQAVSVVQRARLSKRRTFLHPAVSAPHRTHAPLTLTPKVVESPSRAYPGNPPDSSRRSEVKAPTIFRFDSGSSRIFARRLTCPRLDLEICGIFSSRSTATSPALHSARHFTSLTLQSLSSPTSQSSTFSSACAGVRIRD